MESENNAGMKISYNTEGLNGLEQGNNDFFSEMIRLFIESTSSGLIEMAEAMQKKNWELVAEKAHKVLGPCRHLEVMPLSDTLKQIEKNIFELKKTDEIPQLVKKAEAEAEETIKQFEKLIAK